MVVSLWHVRLGEGGRLMTNSQVGAAVARCWIDEETQVRRPRSAEWTTLKDAVPAKEKRRITEEPVMVENIETSGMLLLSGEYEVVSDDGPPTRPSRMAPKLLAAAVLALAGGGYWAHRHPSVLDGKLHAMTAAMSAIGSDLAPAAPAKPAPVATPEPAPIVVSSSSTIALVPKMRAPTPPPPRAMPEPSPPPPVPMKAKATAKHKNGPRQAPPASTTRRAPAATHGRSS